MVELNHDNNPPRLLENRKVRGVPVNPRNAWSNFSTEGKIEIHNNLTPIQGDLCVYCEQKLDKYGFHIEHILSKTLNPQLTFEYSNLSLSCIKDGSISEETTENEISCGHSLLKKNNNYNKNLFIKPTENGCNSLFSYNINGEIESNNYNSDFDRQRVEHTIEVLNLDCLRLNRERREIIEKGYEIILELQNDEEALICFFDLGFNKVNNKYQFPFISARDENYKIFR